MKKYLVIFLLIVIAVALSFVLVPDAREIALMQFRDKEFEKARIAYEQRLAEGNLTVDVVSALTNLHLQSGDVDKAIDIMERFIQQNPDNLQAREELGKLYQYAQRPDDYLVNLEEINRIKKSTASLQTMNEMYAAAQQYDKQEPALQALVGEQGERLPQHYRNLARLQSSQKKFAEAIATYQEFWKAHPKEFKAEDLELLMALQIDQDDLAGAQQSAQQYAQLNNPSLKEVARLVNVLHYRGNPQTALEFLAPYEDKVTQEPELGLEKAYILMAQGKSSEAYEMLKWLDGAMSLPAPVQREYISMLVQHEEYETAKQHLQGLDMAALPETELVSLVELSMYHPKAGLLPIISEKVSALPSVQGFTMLQAALAIANGRDGWAPLVAAIDKTAITETQKLQMANVCLRGGKYSCVDEFMAAVNMDNLAKSELLTAASIYMDRGEYVESFKLIDPLYRQNPQDAEISDMYVQLAAAQGNADEVNRWLAANPNASERALQDIYFVAQKNRHSDIALDAVDLLAKNYQNDQNLAFLIDAYVANGRYEAVLPYFRQKSSMSASDREDYLFVLTKLARKSNKYSAELVEFARSEMRRSGVSQKQKMALVYALMDVGRPEIVLPFIEELARNQGGEWVEVYANNLDKLGRHQEARDFRMKLAMNPKTSDSTRRDIAFALLDHGYKSDAESLFAMLADGAAPSSPDVQQLIYLWGNRPDMSRLEWIAGRYAAEADPANKALWADFIAGYAGRDELLRIVSRFPALVNEKEIQDRYFAALNETNQLGAYGDELMASADASPEALRIYARVARGFNQNDYAKRAYERLNEVAGGDPEAMRVLGILAFSHADYSETLRYLQPYANYRSENPGYDAEDYEALFYLAETYKRDHEDEMAKAYYAKALEAAKALPAETPESVSKVAQSLLGVGQGQDGRGRFDAGTQQFANDRLLVADYISSMLEEKDYDKARALLDSAPQAVALEQGAVGALSLPQSTASRYQVTVNGNEALLKFDRAVPESFPLINASKAEYPWLSYTGQSYDEVLVVAEPQYRLEIQPVASGYQLVAIREQNQAEVDFAKDLDVRYAMLDARLGLETGDHYAVTDKLVTLSEQNPQNATLLGYTANALNFTGRWKYAQKLLEQANAIMPENEDILQLQRDINIRRDAENHLKADYEWLSIGDSDESIWTLSGLVHVDNEVEIGFNAQNADVDAESVRRIDGRVGNFDENVQRGEIFIAHENLDGQRIQASLYGNNDTAGAGMSYQWLNSLGLSRVYGEYHRPNWDYVEGMLDDATRDRIGFDHNYVYNTDWTFQGGLSLNQYNLRTADDVAKTVGGTFSATRKLRDFGPYLAANYSLDAEYRVDESLYTDVNGERYHPLVDSREVHTVSLLAEQELTPNTDGQIQVGYSFDRLGGNGPLVAGQITHQMLDDQLEAQLRGSYGARTSDSEGDTARVGGHLKWRF